MSREQDAKGIEELTEWLEQDDEKSRTLHAGCLTDLLDILPVPEEGLSFLGGEEARIYFDELRPERKFGLRPTERHGMRRRSGGAKSKTGKPRRRRSARNVRDGSLRRE